MKPLFVADRVGKFLLGTFFLVISFSVLALGVVLYQWNPEQISEGSAGNLGEAQQFVVDFQQSHKRLPELEEFNAWSRKDDSGRALCDYQNSDFPDDLTRLAGKSPQDAYYFTCWDDVYSYYASWYENGTVGLITDSDYYWGGSRLMHALIFLGLFIGFGLVASFFYSLAFEKSSKSPKNPA